MRVRMIVIFLTFSVVGAVATAAEPVTLRIAFWNVQSNLPALQSEPHSEILKKQLADKKGISIWGLCEVMNLDMLRKLEEGVEGVEEGDEEGDEEYVKGVPGTDFISIMGTTGAQNRLAILYDSKRFKQVGGAIELKQ